MWLFDASYIYIIYKFTHTYNWTNSSPSAQVNYYFRIAEKKFLTNLDELVIGQSVMIYLPSKNSYKSHTSPVAPSEAVLPHLYSISWTFYTL